MSQKYTEVEWQDPAGGNPGTLINKARLDQMQGAHHYADGFEEVDTVPSADPGVDYHKIVYCTADNAIYRWDGTAWTADIDDPTRELLEEHEADHDNPHQVTKSQVGLGNADNTSDADKPISTATQNALNAKADKSDTYTKTQVDTALATKADKATTYTKTETDTLLGAKADKATTYTKAEIDTAMATKADKATTYTKAEADTLLAGKASTTAVQTLDTRVGALETGLADTYTKAQVDTYLAAKADDDAVVHLAGTETIPGDKEFTGRFAIAQSRNTWAHIQDNTRVLAEVPTTNLDDKIRFDDKNAAETASVLHKTYTDEDIVLRLTLKNRDGQEGIIGIAHTNAAGFFGQAPTPSANAPSNAIVNRSYLDGYEPMVRTTGNQTIYGDKALTGLTDLSQARLVATGGSGYKILYRFKTEHTQTLFITGGRTIVVAQVHRNGGYKKVLATASRDYSTTPWLWSVKDATTGEYYLVCRGLYSATMNIHFINSFQYGSVYPHQDDIEIIDQSTSDPTTDTRWETVTEVGNYD